MLKKFLKFPDKFLWGSATSAHQVEGDCENNDWSVEVYKKDQHKLPWMKNGLEKIPPTVQACAHWQKYAADFELLKDLGHNAYRLSLEWARIEPKKGEFDQVAVAHYRAMLQDLKSKHITIFLTLHHFANPAWLALEGGWENRLVIKHFVRYAEFIARELGDLVDFWQTINEPAGYVFNGYTAGFWPPFKKNNWLAVKVFWHLARAHKKAYRIIHKIVKDKFNQQPSVGFANDVQAYTNYIKHRLLDQLYVYLIYKISNHGFYILTGQKTHDFLGVNYYFPVHLQRRGFSFGQSVNINDGRRLTETNWLIHPHGLYEVLLDLSVYKKPIYITENGIATNDEDLRQRFIHEHLEETYYAIRAGAPVRGYLYWSLLDNYEWAEGYRPKFGLVAINLETQARQVKQSAGYYSRIIKENGLWLDY